MSLSDRFSSPRFVRRVMLGAGLILIAGIVASAIAFVGNTADDPVATPVTPGQPVPNPTPAGPAEKPVPLAREARTVAGQFILTAVTRENMAKAWKITDPNSLVRQCVDRPCTYKEWLRGEVPIQVYPADALEDANFAIDESYPDRAVLQVALLPKDGADIQPQIFYIGLKKVGTGKSARWLVTYWAPRAINPVPNTGDTH